MKTTTKAAALAIGALMVSGAVLAANTPARIPDADSPSARIASDKRAIITPQSIDFGAYDPHGDFAEDRNPKIEHLFLPWEDVDLSTLALADEYARERGRSLMITVRSDSVSSLSKMEFAMRSLSTCRARSMRSAGKVSK